MTHYTVGIIVPPHMLPSIESYIERQMAPFDENLEVAPYVSYSLDQARTDLTRDIVRLERILERQDPNYDLEKCRELLATLRATTPDERYREYTRFHEQFNHDDEPLSTSNPESKWDWYVIGGRWDGWINDRDASSQTVNDNLATTESVVERNKKVHAIITPDGQWHEHGQMGWWGVMLTENEGWESQQASILRQFPGHHILILDAHI